MRKKSLGLLILLTLLLLACVNKDKFEDKPVQETGELTGEEARLGQGGDELKEKKAARDKTKPKVRVEKPEESESPKPGQDDILLQVYTSGRHFTDESPIIIPTSDQYQSERIRIVTELEGVEVRLELGEYMYKMLYFHPFLDIFNLTLEKNQVYEFTAPLPEGIPNMRLVTSQGPYRDEWILSYDGSGERVKVDLVKEKWEPRDLDQWSAEIDLARAGVISAFLAGDVEFYKDSLAYWQNASIALTYIDPYDCVLSGFDEGFDDWTIEPWLLIRTTEAMCPTGFEPESVEPYYFYYDADRTLYYMRPTNYDLSFETTLLDLEKLGDGSYKARIGLTSLHEGIDYYYEVFLKGKDEYDPYSPFEYRIESIKGI